MPKIFEVIHNRYWFIIHMNSRGPIFFLSSAKKGRIALFIELNLISLLSPNCWLASIRVLSPPVEGEISTISFAYMRWLIILVIGHPNLNE